MIRNSTKSTPHAPREVANPHAEREEYIAFGGGRTSGEGAEKRTNAAQGLAAAIAVLGVEAGRSSERLTWSPFKWTRVHSESADGVS